MSKRKMSIVLILVIALGAGIVAKNTVFGGESKATAVATQNKVAVKVQKAEEGSIGSKMLFKASLEASEEGIISNKAGGKVIKIFIENGTVVAQGDPLVKLDDTDIRNNIESSEAQLVASEAQLKSAENQLTSSQMGLQKPETNLETAQRGYDRTKTLFDQGVCSKVELENAESTLKSAKTDFESAKINIDSSRLSVETQKANIQTANVNLKTLKNSLENTTIVAPLSGIIDEKNVNVGQYLNMGVVLGKVKNISPIYAVIQVNQNELANIKLGEKATLKVNGTASDVYEGTIKNIDAAADSTARVFKCKIELDNKNGELKAGVFGQVEISTNQDRKVIALPLEVLGGSEGNYYVFVNDNGVARKRTVLTGEVSKDVVEIKEGLQKGDAVITTNVNSLLDGDAVTVVSK